MRLGTRGVPLIPGDDLLSLRVTSDRRQSAFRGRTWHDLVPVRRTHGQTTRTAAMIGAFCKVASGTCMTVHGCRHRPAISALDFTKRFRVTGVSSQEIIMLNGDNSAMTPPNVAIGLNAAIAGIETVLDDEVESLAEALTLKFEELTLIHQLSERLKLDEDSDLICQSLLEELEPCVGTVTIAIDLFADEEGQYESQLFLSGEECTQERLRRIADYTSATAVTTCQSMQLGVRVAINNSPCVAAPAQVRSLVVPIEREGTRLGRMIAIRSLDTNEFGTVEADLMKSTSMMLGAHLINQRQYHEMQQMFEGTIQSLVSALDAKDTYTCGHSSRVADLAVELAERLNFDEDGVSRIRMAGILHDIGKIGVDDSVLRKPGKLTDDEFEQIKQHPVLGYEILQGIRPFRKILPAVRHHHESWDGSGYPDGLQGASIPRDAQVLAVADAFDAMTSDRPYREGMPLEKVCDIFRNGRGSQWAADVVDVLLDCPEVMHAYANHDGNLTE